MRETAYVAPQLIIVLLSRVMNHGTPVNVGVAFAAGIFNASFTIDELLLCTRMIGMSQKRHGIQQAIMT